MGILTRYFKRDLKALGFQAVEENSEETVLTKDFETYKTKTVYTATITINKFGVPSLRITTSTGEAISFGLNELSNSYRFNQVDQHALDEASKVLAAMAYLAERREDD